MARHTLHGGMFDVSATALHDGHEVEAVHSIPICDDVIALCLFAPQNPEIFIKVLDGCAVNGHRWVQVAGMTDLETTVTVRNAQGAVWTYRHPGGTPFIPKTDLKAFPCP